jgi:DNA-binding transcriptional LysR family regulator
MSLSVGHLQAIVRVADQGSFTRAAEGLHITQPALSHRIAQAERLLGVRLFDRVRRSVTVTAAGRNVVETARRALGAYERGIDKVYAAAGSARSAVHIATLPSLAAVVLPAALRDLGSQMREIRCTVTAAHSVDVTSLVQGGGCDFGLTTLDEPDPALWSVLVREDPFVALLPPTHHLAREGSAAWALLLQERFIMPPLSSSLHHILLETFRKTGQFPSDTMAGGEISLTAGLVAAGLGVAVVPQLTLPLTQFADVAIKEIAGPKISRSIRCIGRRDSPLDPTSLMLLNAIKANLA